MKLKHVVVDNHPDKRSILDTVSFKTIIAVVNSRMCHSFHCHEFVKWLTVTGTTQCHEYNFFANKSQQKIHIYY